MARYWIDFIYLDEVIDFVEGMQHRILNWTEMNPRIHDWVIVRFKEIFATEGASEGIRWPNYDATEFMYRDVKNRILGNLSLLRWTETGGPKAGKNERLYPSYIHPKNSEHVWSVTPGRQIEVGSEVPYAWKHQRGGMKNQMGGTIQQRKIELSRRSQFRLSILITQFVLRGEKKFATIGEGENKRQVGNVFRR